MAQLKSSVVQGSLRVTDTTYTTSIQANSLLLPSANTTDAFHEVTSIRNNESTGSLNWTAKGTNAKELITTNTLAYWNGLYSASTSNLLYCKEGKFGNMAIKIKGNGFSDSDNIISVAYGTSANTAVQGNQTIFTLNGSAKNSGSSASFYAPTSAGTNNQILVSTGGAPGWQATANGAAYATSENGALTFGALPIAQGGTGKTSAADAWTALGGGASGKHANSYFVKAITSTDTNIPRFDGTGGQLQSSRMSINDTGVISVSYNGRYPGDTKYSNAAGIVGEFWLDTGHATNVTSPRFIWRVWRPKSTAATTTESQHETFRLPAATAGTADSATYDIITTKNLSSITAVGTITSGTWEGTTLAVAHGGTGKTTALAAATNLGAPYLLATGETISEAANLDTGYKAMGTYYSGDSNRSGSLTGTVPITGSGFKLITTVGYRAATLRQFMGGASNELLYRSTQNTGTDWTKWHKFVLLPSGADEKTFAAIGTTTRPVYVAADGIVTLCSTYAGGTRVVLNGSSKSGASASFYAPTTVGSNNQVLTSDGSGAPNWKTPEANAAVKTFAITWASGTSYTYSNSWITEDAAVVATDLQTKALPGIVTWTIPSGGGKIKFECATAPSNLSFNIMMLKEINYDS